MKTLLLICMALIFVANAHAQEVRLDSLWAKFGGVGAMSFSPDSKTLLIAEPPKLAGGSGTIRLHDPQTGIEKGNIPGTSYTSVDYTPDGKYIIMGCTDGTVKLYDPVTLELYKAIPCIYGGYFAFSPDGTKAALASEKYIAIVDLASEVFLTVITRPDQYSVGPNKFEPYNNGKVCFSADGNYIFGKYRGSMATWDWRNAPDNPQTLFGLPNFAILGFSPDKSLFVLQSNYLWSMAEKKQLPVEGMVSNNDETGYNATFTANGKYLFCLEKNLVTIVNAEVKK
jgi:WD40 repeat protein